MGCTGSSTANAISMADDSMALNKARLRADLPAPENALGGTGSIFDSLPEPEAAKKGDESSEDESDNEKEGKKEKRQRRTARCRTKFIPRDLAMEAVATVSRSVTRLKMGMEKARRTTAEQVEHVIDGNPVVLFSKTMSDESHSVWSAISECAANFMVVEVEKLLVGDVDGYCDYLEEKTGVYGGLPCMFIRGAFVGGADEIAKLLKSGQLMALCSDAGAPSPTAKECKSMALRRMKKEAQRQAEREAQEAEENGAW